MRGKRLINFIYILILAMFLVITNLIYKGYLQIITKDYLRGTTSILINDKNMDMNKIRDELLKYDVTLLATYYDNENVGIYDKPGYFHSNSSKRWDISSYRYFSNSDYENGSDVKIQVEENGCEGKNVIHCFIDITPLPISNSNPVLLNFFAYMDNVNKVYLINDYDHTVKNLMLKNGLQEISFPYTNIIKIIQFGFTNNPNLFTISILISSLMLVPLFCYYLFINFKLQKDEILLHKKVGLSFKTILLKYFMKLFLGVLFSSIIVSGIFYIGMHKFSELFLHIATIIEINLFMLILTLGIYLSLFSYYYFKEVN